MKKIVLASSSARRKDIITKMGLEFEVVSSFYEEVLENSDFNYEKIEKLALGKAKEVAIRLKSLVVNDMPEFVIGADTVVVFDGLIFGKPKDEQEAFEMLKALSGNVHFVVTSICVIDFKTGEHKISSTTSYVEFEKLTDEMIKFYIQNYKPFDKAGSYGIQELPSGYVKSIDGSLENIIGLCSAALNQLLNGFD